MRSYGSAENDLALNRLYSVVPVWRGVVKASEALSLPAYTLLHAGPAFKDPTVPSAPILSSAALSSVYEGWADSPETAISLIRSGKIALRSAQEFGAVVPLAAVISPSTTLVEIVDINNPVPGICWSELSTGPGPMLRFGSGDMAIIERMRFREKVLAPALSAMIGNKPIPLFPHALNGLKNGDDLHASTLSATSSLAEEFAKRNSSDKLRNEAISLLHDTPLFFLTLWMAACQLMLNAMAKNGSSSSLVVALAGNGQQCGIRVSGQPDRWITAIAGKPTGNTDCEPSEVCGVVGDSGCIDAVGFGAQLRYHRTSRNMDRLSTETFVDEALWGGGKHPYFSQYISLSAIDISKISQSRVLPEIAIAMLDARGKIGLLGKGIYKTETVMYLSGVGG
ncbi:hypothetical protein HA49_22505 [Tatumella morbirosei]|uniref:Uncharacterized protein n=1 Tax=Tatumella morbirosei TaxID=642227 RepID=A0A0F5BUU6_9GAMM|nr:hypothetical protein HA49_22505 [Tatumella morbirosei]